MHARKACAHSGNAGQGLLPSRPQGHALLAPIRVGLRPEGLPATLGYAGAGRVRRPQPALMEHQNRYGFRALYFSDTTLAPPLLPEMAIRILQSHVILHERHEIGLQGRFQAKGTVGQIKQVSNADFIRCLSCRLEADVLQLVSFLVGQKASFR